MENSFTATVDHFQLSFQRKRLKMHKTRILLQGKHCGAKASILIAQSMGAKCNMQPGGASAPCSKRLCLSILLFSVYVDVRTNEFNHYSVTQILTYNRAIPPPRSRSRGFKRPALYVYRLRLQAPSSGQS
ncbi:hypothetical protein RRG08_012580 [Elysia crispata]|uniref:Uncharacterized protein n=1 Tax=Elysia crispata TaxID=231223 RepID=A0AAE1E3D5_9GAST|nr:hypothetical protein RRG08_012580 [Elysia crispata]